MTEGPVISAVETVLDNGKHGTRTVKFETGLLSAGVEVMPACLDLRGPVFDRGPQIS